MSRGNEKETIQPGVRPNPISIPRRPLPGSGHQAWYIKASDVSGRQDRRQGPADGNLSATPTTSWRCFSSREDWRKQARPHASGKRAALVVAIACACGFQLIIRWPWYVRTSSDGQQGAVQWGEHATACTSSDSRCTARCYSIQGLSTAFVQVKVQGAQVVWIMMASSHFWWIYPLADIALPFFFSSGVPDVFMHGLLLLQRMYCTCTVLQQAVAASSRQQPRQKLARHSPHWPAMEKSSSLQETDIQLLPTTAG